MNSIHEFMEYVMEIVLSENLRVGYSLFLDKVGLCTIFEGEYKHKEKLILINSEYKDTELEPFLIAHELGHHFNFSEYKDNKITLHDFEIIADEYMISLADKFGLKDIAVMNKEFHQRNII